MKLGRLVYFSIFQFFSLCSTFLIDKNIKIWYRNSILVSYFKFARSDLDLSIYFSDTKNYFKKSLRIRRLSSLFVIIKEINFYPRDLIIICSQTINPYEAERDPELKKFFSALQEKNESNRLCYLLRIFFSEARGLDSPLNSRSKAKWSFHLNSICNLDIPPEKISTYRNLLSIILKLHLKHESERYMIALDQLLNSSVPDHVFFEKSQQKDDLISMLPHRFCFEITNWHPLETTNIPLILSQISWELWAMSSQPWQYENTETAFQHLNNLKYFLLKIEQACNKDQIFLCKQLLMANNEITIFMKKQIGFQDAV